MATINLNGIEIEFADDAVIKVSKDGKRIKIGSPASKVIEKIRFIEVAGPERVVERIRIVEVEKPCIRPHYHYYSQPQYTPYQPTWGTTTSTGIFGTTYATGGNLTPVSTTKI